MKHTPFKKVLKVSNFPQGNKYVPGIRIAGKYLKNLGFSFRDEVIITCEQGQITIQKIGGKHE